MTLKHPSQPVPANALAVEVATRLSGKIAELGPFELLTRGDELPVLAFKLRDDASTGTAFAH